MFTYLGSRVNFDTCKKSINLDSDSEKPLTPLEKLLQDNQISRAVDMIRGISLFNKNELSQKTFSAKN